MAFSSVFRRVNVKELISNASVYACAAESSGAMSLVFRPWATKKTAGSTKNGRDSNPKYLGVKESGTRKHNCSPKRNAFPPWELCQHGQRSHSLLPEGRPCAVRAQQAHWQEMGSC
ncbi:hypothetical protein SEVIR_1G369402v4 [Setaria viridis]